MVGIGLVWLIIIGTSIWVAIDASNIGARKGLVKGVANMGPAGWFFCCLLIWIIGFPVYLAKRPEIKTAAATSKVVPSMPGYPPPVAQIPMSPPGWYPSPPSPTQPLDEGCIGLSVPSSADELFKLEALRKSGALSEEEFESEKAKVLGG